MNLMHELLRHILVVGAWSGGAGAAFVLVIEFWRSRGTPRGDRIVDRLGVERHWILCFYILAMQSVIVHFQFPSAPLGWRVASNILAGLGMGLGTAAILRFRARMPQRQRSRPPAIRRLPLGVHPAGGERPLQRPSGRRDAG